MKWNAIENYIRFVHNNRRVYFVFNKQLLVGGLVGLLSGVAVAEVVALLTTDEIVISVSSGIVDYVFSILGFLAVYYHDNKSQYTGSIRKTEKAWRITRSALSLWPTVVAADIAYLITRPYVHSIFLSLDIETGLAAAMAHFIGVGVFNGVAVLSRSIMDYLRASDRDIQAGEKSREHKKGNCSNGLQD